MSVAAILLGLGSLANLLTLLIPSAEGVPPFVIYLNFMLGVSPQGCDCFASLAFNYEQPHFH
jgi:hypothetical protein